jgi:iron complex outermembrane receptor protein
VNKTAIRRLEGAAWTCILAVAALPTGAQERSSEPSNVQLSPVVVTATRVEQRSFDLPVAISSVGQEQIQETAKLRVNISEQLNSVPGTVVQARENFAQEQQIIIRGFGARSQFGTRGVKLLADGIPASTPDGQGGPGLFDLDSAKRIEVLRGPFSALYGNHSGGVVQLFTEDGPARPTLSVDAMAGSWETWKAGAKFGGTTAGGLNYIGSLSTFNTQGYRDHSSARKDQFNAKLQSALSNGASLSFVVNYLNQPDNKDPLGLTAAQVAQNPRQAGTNAQTFNSRRSLDNLQAGLVYEQALSDVDTLRGIVYGGQRNNDGYLAIPLATQNQVTGSGGVTVLERSFAGLGLRWTRKGTLAGNPLTLTVGGDYDGAWEGRRGYINNNGVQGQLKRDEDNSVQSWGGYVQGEWQALERLSVSAGLRYTSVGFDSKDKFICTGLTGLCAGATAVAGNTQNPDDSGSVTYGAWTPVAGLLFKLTPSVNLYANAGRSFETPTFIELAYRANNQSGLNFALQPAKSDHYEVGVKAFLGPDTRVDLALFQINTRDEIVVESNSGGRATFQNADKTKRTGVELSLDSNLPAGLRALVAATYMNATFEGPFTTCPIPAPTGGPPCPAAARVTIPAGNNIPAIPRFLVYGDLSWRHEPTGFGTGLEVRWQGKAFVNDANSEFADALTVVNLRAGLQRTFGSWRLQAYGRVDNLFDENYIGGIVVNDANGRFYAPAPTRAYLVGLSASHQF